MKRRAQESKAVEFIRYHASELAQREREKMRDARRRETCEITRDGVMAGVKVKLERLAVGILILPFISLILCS